MRIHRGTVRAWGSRLALLAVVALLLSPVLPCLDDHGSHPAEAGVGDQCLHVARAEGHAKADGHDGLPQKCSAPCGCSCHLAAMPTPDARPAIPPPVATLFARTGPLRPDVPAGSIFQPPRASA